MLCTYSSQEKQKQKENGQNKTDGSRHGMTGRVFMNAAVVLPYPGRQHRVKRVALRYFFPHALIEAADDDRVRPPVCSMI